MTLTLTIIIDAIAATGIFNCGRVLWQRRARLRNLESTAQTIAAAGMEPDSIVVIHHTGPCPEGWLFVPELFTERSGAKESGCVLPARTISQECKVHIDYLKGGESIETPLRFHVDQP